MRTCEQAGRKDEAFRWLEAAVKERMTLIPWIRQNPAYARSVGKGEGKIAVPYFELEGQMLKESLATGYFNEPLHKSLSEALLTPTSRRG